MLFPLIAGRGEHEMRSDDDRLIIDFWDHAIRFSLAQAKEQP
jgi:hypothetical protein